MIAKTFLTAVALAAVCAAASLFASWFSRKLVFHPSRLASPELAALAGERGLIPWCLPAGSRIGWQTPGGNRSLLIFHGNAGHAADRADLAALLQNADPSRKIFILEYPGYGDRPGTPSEKSFVRAATEALSVFPPDTPPLVLGESIGTGVASLAASANPAKVQGLILLTPFRSLVDVGRHHYPGLPVGLLLTERFDSAKALAGFPKPVAFIIAREDETTPAETGLALHAGFDGPKHLTLVEAAGHNEAGFHLGIEGWRPVLGFFP